MVGAASVEAAVIVVLALTVALERDVWLESFFLLEAAEVERNVGDEYCSGGRFSALGGAWPTGRGEDDDEDDDSTRSTRSLLKG